MSQRKYRPRLVIALVIVATFLLSQTATLANPPSQGPGLHTTPFPTVTPNYDENQNPHPGLQGRESQSAPYVTSNPDKNANTPVSLQISGPRVSPSRISVTLNPGENHNNQIQVFTGDVPIGKGDIMFLFDRTASMGDEIDEAKSSAVQIMNDIRVQLAYAWFGVGSFMDYPGHYEYPGYSATYGSASSGDVPWELNINPINDFSA